ncbi:MAG: 3-hydroxyacyl-CoA dehydrogenase NAD-binding domain-containing protein, partial [Thermoplasmata archaeon]
MVTPSLRPPAIVAVLGGGNMGSGIAQACAQAGFTVRVRDVDAPAIERGRGLIEKMLTGAVERKKLTATKRTEVLARVTFTTDLAEAVSGAALVIEAVFEEESVKRALFGQIAPLVGPDTVVVTNTSSLSVTGLGEGFPQPGRFGGLHFFFPAAINRLVEVIGGAATDPATLDELVRFCYLLRKIPIETRDRAGFCVNRFFVPYLNEAARLAEENVASLATIEEVGRELFGATLGPFELMNVTGIPIAFHAESSLYRAFGPAYAPSGRLEQQFRAGTPWGWKETTVEPEKKAAVRERLLGLTLGIATQLVEEGVASPEATDRGATVGLRRRWGPFAQLSEVGLSEGLGLVEAYARRWPGNFPVAPSLRDRAVRGERRWPIALVRVERKGPVAWVLLDRPEVLNSLNSEVLLQVESTFRDLEGAPGLRAVVLAGSSPVFAAGADIEEMSRKTLAEGVEFGFLGQRVAERIERFPTPVVALVEGYALGGGLELALAADFIVAAEGSQLGLPEVGLGIHPGMGGATRLTRLIGRARTKLLVYTGARVSAEEAYRLGFVAKIVPAGTARAEVSA